MAETLTDFIASQEDLVQEASLALPHQFSECTYSRGHIRQAVYLCKTCPEPRGLCAACSVACHTDHEQLELFPKRHFRCDCPTTTLAQPCALRPKLEEPNSANSYGQNFTGVFCRCGRPYDPHAERETMIQCLSCEEWFHESCCNLRERPTSREPTPEPLPQKAADENEEAAQDDARSEASSSGLPAPLITGTEYESFVCAGCVSSIPILKRYAGTPGALMIVRKDPSSAWKRLELPSLDEPVLAIDDCESSAAGTKRPRSLSPPDATEGGVSKKSRLSSPTAAAEEPSPSLCLAPPLNPVAQEVLTGKPNASVFGAGDIFLEEGFRDRWCRCASCLPQLQAHPFLLEEEETYEPPEDPDSGLSLEELGMRALERLPRDKAIEGIHAFNSMRYMLHYYFVMIWFT
ncbi:hypothetical protein HGRIS_014068 [Hohenbuehelia grisea]|uniref:UBR-type domain-containing protein n=1 Tax=Hohenbuehelia grisea TaxID=104357 RepID=A0ABR3JSF5_9AGAR